MAKAAVCKTATMETTVVRFHPCPPNNRMKLHKWKTIRRKLEGVLEEEEKTKESLSSFEDIIKAMDIYPQTSSSLSSSDARIQIDSEHNSGYNNK